MVEVKNLTKSYGDLVAVDNLSFTVNPGDIFALLGTNGAGKTTTFRVLTGLLTPNKGTVTYNGQSMGYNISDIVGYLVEERALLPKLTVRKLVVHYGRLKGLNEDEILPKLDYWLKRMGITDYKDKKIKELSKGNQQKIQFITTIINDPKVMILDEPFTGLDPLNIEIMIDIIREFQQKGSCIIFSTHRIDHVELFCENLAVLLRGKTVISGNIDQIKDDFKRKTIKIQGDIDVDALKKIKGVLKVKENLKEYEVSVSDNSISEVLFDYVKTCKNVTKYVVEKPSLSEIFIEKVGEAYND